MKLFTRRLLQGICFLWIALTIPGCDPGKPGIWQNDGIVSSKRTDFHKLNDQLFTAFKANNIHDVENVMSKELLETQGNPRQVELISNQSQLGKYYLFDEFYIVSLFKDGEQKIKIKSSGKHNYNLNLKGIAKEMYIAMMIPETKGEKQMVTLIYCKYDYGWKLTKMEMEPYTINGKTAVELYEQSKQLKIKNYIVDALRTMELSNKCAQPNEIWSYPNDVEMNKLYSDLMKYCNDAYSFPMVVDKVPTKPQIFNIVNQTLAEGVFPNVYYISKINIKDTIALHKESAQVKKAIGSLLPGIDKDKKYILFSVFNERPSATKNTPSFDITEEL